MTETEYFVREHCALKKVHIYLFRHNRAFLYHFRCVAVQETRRGGILQMFCTALIYSTFNAVSVSHCAFVLQPIKAVLRREIPCPRSPSPRCLSFQLSRFDARRRQGKAWLKNMVTFVTFPQTSAWLQGYLFQKSYATENPNCDFFFFFKPHSKRMQTTSSLLFI